MVMLFLADSLCWLL